MTQRRTCQFDLFPNSDAPPAVPAAVEEEVLALLVQLLQSMIPVVESEAADDQDHR